MRLIELVRERRQEILRIAAKHGAHNVRVFGSVSRGEGGPESDVDFLVDMDLGRTLFDIGGLLMDLQDVLGHEVDVVTERGLKREFETVSSKKRYLCERQSHFGVSRISKRKFMI
jgi:predicted nucleotidyltransferase